MAGSRRPVPDGNSPQRATTSAIHNPANGENPANKEKNGRLCTRLCTYPYALGATGAVISTADPHATMASLPSSRYTCRRLPMPSPSSRVSTRLKRAAVAERAQLAKRRERIERARVGVRTELERLE